MRRQSFGGWPSPSAWYITDGIISMWDGENNTGIGSHSASPSTWEDLYGNNDMTIYSGQFNAKSYQCSSYRCARLEQDIPNVLTFEIVLKSSVTSTAQMVFAYNRWNYRPNDRQFIGFSLRANNTVNFRGYGQCFKIQDQRTLATYTNANDTKFYLNAVEKQGEGTGASFAVQSVSGGVNCYQSNQYCFSGEIYNIRLYNRQLTDAEILHNFSVDSQRFGI